MLRLLEGREDLRAVTLVMPQARVAGGRLSRLDARAPLVRLKRQIERAELPGPVLMGGLDLSLEIDRRHGGPDAWQLHVHGIMSGCPPQKLRRALRRHYAATEEVEEPRHMDPVEDRPEQISYCFKSLHRRRVRGAGSEGEPTTAMHPLRDGEWRELLRWLDRYRFAELLFLKGVRRYGSRLRLLEPVPSRKGPGAGQPGGLGRST